MLCPKVNDKEQTELRSDENQSQDVSIPVYKILSCIHQMDQAFNREMIIATLRGAKKQTLFQLELHRLAAYGSMVRYSEKQINQLMQGLFDEGALWESAGRYQSVKLGEAARVMLQQKQAE